MSKGRFSNYFDTLGELENILNSDGRPFLTGDNLTEADLRLFPTLFRHDPIYFLRMKLNGARILDFPNLWRWLCRVYAMPRVAESNSLIHCQQGYFGRSWNNVVPLGPLLPMRYPEIYEHPELAIKWYNNRTESRRDDQSSNLKINFNIKLIIFKFSLISFYKLQ